MGKLGKTHGETGKNQGKNWEKPGNAGKEGKAAKLSSVVN